MGKKLTAMILSVCLIMSLTISAVALEESTEVTPAELAVLSAADEAVASDSLSSLPAKSTILIEQGTGKVLFENNADEPLAPASITKVMTMLLVMEAIDDHKTLKLDDLVSCSDYASSMGGSQIWLKPGEQMTVDEMLRATAIASANDAAVALAEHIAGSEESFVAMMNERAKELGMKNTTFLNASGLDEDGHLTSARDIAIMSAALLKHTAITKYTSTWMDELRGGETELVNTNKLVRFFNGATGLKTGTTDAAGVCIAASATRDGMSLIAVTLGSKTSDERFMTAKSLLNYGFANFAAVTLPSISDQLQPVKVKLGVMPLAKVSCNPPATIIVGKADKENITQKVTLNEDIEAPVEKDQTLGKVEIFIGEEKLDEYPIVSAETVERRGFFKSFSMLFDAATRLK